MAGKRPRIPGATGRPTGPSISVSERGMMAAKLLPNKKARLTKTPGRVYLSAGFGPGGAGYPKGHKPIKEYPHARERGLSPVGGTQSRESGRGGATLASYKASGSESDAARRRRKVRELRERARKIRENTESENPAGSGSKYA